MAGERFKSAMICEPRAEVMPARRQKAFREEIPLPFMESAI
jgi:hypothetical protein